MKTITTKKPYKYVVAQEGSKAVQKIRIKTEAEKDIHITFSKTKEIDKESPEIVLGGGNGKFSGIRAVHLGENVESCHHKKGEFDQLRKNFVVQTTDNKLAVHNKAGDTILEYDDFDSAGLKFMHISTWGCKSKFEIQSLKVEQKKKVAAPVGNFEPFQIQALEKHNDLRALHKDTGPLTLDEGLCNDAQKWAEYLTSRRVMEHDPVCQTDTKPQSENIWYKQGTPGYVQHTPDSALEATKSWYDEINVYNWYGTDNNQMCNDPCQTVNHFTQLVWDDTTKMGIGMASDPDLTYITVVARYTSRGNWAPFTEHVGLLK